MPTPRRASTASRTSRLQLYVDIPPSPLHRTPSLRSLHVSGHKENAPGDNSMSSSPNKRKLSNRDTADSHSDADATASAPPKAKKQKLTKSASMTSMKPPKKAVSTTSAALKIKPSNANEEYPDGYFYCHQCAKKRDNSVGLQCTFATDASNKVHDARCRAKYCKSCLKNRYGEESDDIRAAGETGKPRGHIKGLGYIFKCPRCKDACNCRACRKAKGLEPTGNLTLAARKSGIESVADMLNQDPSAQGIQPGKGRHTATETKPKASKVDKVKRTDIATSVAPSASTSKTLAASTTKAKPKTESVPKPAAKPKALPKPKPLPQPEWEPVPTSLSYSSAESRMYVREFVMRFSMGGLLDVTKTHLDEFDELGGRGMSEGEDEGEVEVGWVSEGCVRSVLMALLGLFLASDNAGVGVKKFVPDAIKDIRACGSNLNRIWGVMFTLRESLNASHHSNTSPTLTFPDPLPPSASTIYHNTRSGVTTRHAAASSSTTAQNHNHGGVYVAQSSQLVPVLVALIDQAVGLSNVKEELEKGGDVSKEKTKDMRDALKAENERWEKERTVALFRPPRFEIKVARELHKQNLLDIEQALKVLVCSTIPRSGPLGKDGDGRIYWLLGPGASEREAAANVLTDGGGNGRISKRAMVGGEERRGMRRWSWFLSVWGTRPELRGNEKGKDQEEEEEEEDGQDQWWGFSDPEEIKKLAGWIEGKWKVEGDGIYASDVDASSRASSPLSEFSEGDDVDMDGPPSKTGLRELIKGLREYAELLEWRVKKWDRDEEGTDKNTLAGTVSARKFYGP
ncbi:hypothetical protein JAAARDRAFT_193771 [Jaapia argillacea MUCL 33604]|uniref:Zinc-finger domain-containing protein n=1 Tax=Jaapia argillacea MUCL 33604 TaxID=933084 RepID=A0A067Q4E7_9AGAM|nr:hypothetical protein JAAARDRAFT_193771 [Jaapia argillacea MUCL 33604]